MTAKDYSICLDIKGATESQSKSVTVICSASEVEGFIFNGDMELLVRKIEHRGGGNGTLIQGFALTGPLDDFKLHAFSGVTHKKGPNFSGYIKIFSEPTIFDFASPLKFTRCNQ